MNQDAASFHTVRTTRIIFAMKTIRSLADGYWLIAFALYIGHFGFGANGTSIRNTLEGMCVKTAVLSSPT